MTTATEQMQRTPLYDAHVAAGAKMVPFGGWEMPLHYGSQIEEHHATRTACGLFDVSHMGEVEIKGPHALQIVNEIVTQDVSILNDGDEIYTVMCRDDGGMIDDLIVSRFGPDHYFLVVNASTYRGDVTFMQFIAERLGLNDTELIPCSEQWAMIAVQGPRSAEIMKTVIGPGEWERLKPFKTRRMLYRGEELIFSATGYTGEPGAELLVPPANAEPLWNELVAAGGKPCGLAARDTLRLEKGYCLSGQDFTEANNPYEAGLARVVKLDKPSFSGKAALAAIKAGGAERRLIGFLPEGKRIPRHNAQVFYANSAIGEITSGGFSPSLNHPIALGYVPVAFAEPGRGVDISLGSTYIKAVVTRPPFYP